MKATSGTYQNMFLKRNDKMISLKNDVTEFCEKYIKPVHPKIGIGANAILTTPKTTPLLKKRVL